jgi:hypothetical protein
MSWDSTNFTKPFAIAADIALRFRVGQPFPSVWLCRIHRRSDYGCPTTFYEVFVELAEYKDQLSSFKPTGGSAKWQDFNYDGINTPCAAIYEQPSDSCLLDPRSKTPSQRPHCSPR